MNPINLEDLAETRHITRDLAVALRTNANVLIEGPTGVGKSRMAQWIHSNSARARARFVTVNLATLSEGTFESELFGHERGAFTGAEMRRVGRLEIAAGGTVFLDELGELSLRQQRRLLEFLQSHTITPVGGNRELLLDVRVIAATHRNLEEDVRAGKFREDLFHRLRVLSIKLNPIIGLEEGLDGAVHRVLAEICAETSKSVLRISDSAAAALESYTWPGNYRELRHVLEYAVLVSTHSVIELEDLPEWFVAARRAGRSKERGETAELGSIEVPISIDYHKAIKQFERRYLTCAFGRFGGRLNRTSREIGMSKSALIRRIREYGITV